MSKGKRRRWRNRHRNRVRQLAKFWVFYDALSDQFNLGYDPCVSFSLVWWDADVIEDRDAHLGRAWREP